MNNYKLILLKDGRNILVSDEEIKEETLFIDNFKYFICRNIFEHGIEDDEGLLHKFENCKKIIAGISPLPTLTYSDEVKQELRDKYGRVDVEELAWDVINNNSSLIENREQIVGFTSFCEGFSLHQSITNKMFSLKTVIDIIENEKYGQGSVNRDEYKSRILDKIQSLQQPIQLNVEIETKEIEYGHVDNYTEPHGFKIEPKLTNNSIQILKIIQ